MELPAERILSLCIPTHDGRASSLGELLDTIERQLTPQLAAHVELCISDNASRDGTAELVERLRERRPALRCVYRRHDRDLGAGRNIFSAVEAAGGDFCWILGSDDQLFDDALVRVMGLLHSCPQVSGLLVAGSMFAPDMSRPVDQLNRAFFPSADRAVVFRGEREVLEELSIGFIALSFSVVHRRRWLTQQRRHRELALSHPGWPHLVVLREMVRADPVWAWCPDPLVKVRTGSGYYQGEHGELESGYASLQTGIATTFRAVLGELHGDQPAMFRGLMRRYFAALGPDRVLIERLKARAGQTLALDARLLVEYLRAFWLVPAFWRRTLPALLEPHALVKARRRRRAAPMEALPPSACRTHIEIDIPRLAYARSVQWGVGCRVLNEGPQPLTSSAPYPVHIGYRWFSEDGREVVLDGFRVRLPGRVGPHHSVQVRCDLIAPAQPGRYQLRVAPVQERVAWFDDLDAGNGVAAMVEVRMHGGL